MAQEYRKNKKLNRSYLKLDQQACDAMMDLFMFVNNINQAPDLAIRGGVYKKIAEADVFTVKFNGWVVGYKLEDHNIFFRRKIFLNCEQPLRTVPEEQKDPVLGALMDIFLEKGQSLPSITYTDETALVVQQDVIPFVMTEKNPHLVSKGPKGKVFH